MAKKQRTKHRTDLDYMKDQDCWGLWPYLPIKRHRDGKGELIGNTLECGLLWAYRTFCDPPAPIPVFMAFVYRLPPTKEDFLATKKYEYENLEALVADGWVIDD